MKNFEIYWPSRLPRDLRYIGYRLDCDAWGTAMHSVGFWWFHVYWTFGEHI